MNRNDITNTAYEVIKDGIREDHLFNSKVEYTCFLNGVIAITEKMIDKYCNQPTMYCPDLWDEDWEDK